MKRVLLVMLSVAVLVSSCMICSFAENKKFSDAEHINYFEDIDEFDMAANNMSINMHENCTEGVQLAHCDSNYISSRVDWTPNRAQAGTKTGLFVKGVEGADGQCIKYVTSSCMFPDPGHWSGNYFVSVDLMPTKVTSFAGMLVDYTPEITDSTMASNPLVEVVAHQGDTYDYVCESGWGFTFLKDNKTSIRVFVNATASGSVDYLDIDLGLGDLTTAWHTYAMYRLCNNTDGKQAAFILVDDKPVAKVEKDTIYSLLSDAKTENCNEIQDIGTAALSFVGTDIEVYMDNLQVNDTTRCGDWIGTVSIADATAYLNNLAEVINPIAMYTAINSDPSAWLGNTNSPETEVKFNAAAPFTAISFPNEWGDEEGYTITITASQNGEVVATSVKEGRSNMGALTFEFDKTVPAGETTINISIADGSSGHYIVFPKATEYNDNVEFTGVAAAFSIIPEKAFSGEFFLEISADPEPVPTADASLVIFVVAAVAVALVVLKKKEF